MRIRLEHKHESPSSFITNFTKQSKNKGAAYFSSMVPRVGDRGAAEANKFCFFYPQKLKMNNF
jgi:hypothetical protein